MCVYNGAEKGDLHRSVPSILTQSYSRFEFIIIEDGSSDDSYRVLKDYAAKDKRIRLFQNDKNRGISYSSNRGNSLARGKYIMVMDQDDTSHPDRIKKQTAFMEENPHVDICATPSQTPAPWLSVYDNDTIKFMLFLGNMYGHPNLMMRRAFMEEKNIRYNEKYKCANDYDMLIQMRDRGAYFATMKEALFSYNGKGYSGIPNTPCHAESIEIASRWLEPKVKTTEEYAMAILDKIIKTKEYHHLFTPLFLEKMNQYFHETVAQQNKTESK